MSSDGSDEDDEDVGELVTIKRSELVKICETMVSLKRRVGELEVLYGRHNHNKGRNENG